MISSLHRISSLHYPQSAVPQFALQQCFTS
jgi:hypothetical protein